MKLKLATVLLGDGLRLFQHLYAETIELETMDVIESPGETHLRYRVEKEL
jgi:hypothetical protein